MKPRNAMQSVLAVVALAALWLGGAAPGVSFTLACCVTDPVVTNNSDSGAGSLRDAISAACSGSKITFANTVAGTITLASELAIDQNLTIQGPGANALTISGNHAVRVLDIGNLVPGINVTLSGLTIANGHVGPGVRFSGGGGILNRATGTVTIVNCAVSDNSVDGVSDGEGGGILNLSADQGGGTLNVTNSTISGNSVSSDGDPRFGGSGGGIFNDVRDTLNVTNSTISGNTVSGISGAGGGIFNNEAGGLFGAVNLTNSTLSGNTANGSSAGSFQAEGGGLWNGGDHGHGVSMKNTIVAGNTVTVDGTPAIRGPDVAGAVISQGYNLIGNSQDSSGFTTVNHDQIDLDPMLDPRGLRDNGGPTQTIALLPGSHAIDQGSAANDPATGNPITTDQRGFARPVDIPGTTIPMGGNGSDIGAFEFLPTACVPPPKTAMVAWYPFDETTGALSANLATGNSGVQVGGPTPVPGMVAGALRFDGATNYVESPSSIVTNIGPADFSPTCGGHHSSCPGNFSIDTWIRVGRVGVSPMTILDKRAGSPPVIKGYHLFILQEFLGLQLADGLGSGFSSYISPAVPNLDDGNWHHIAVTVQRTAHTGIRWYHNGILFGNSDPTDRPGSLESDSPLRIGTRTAAPPLSGWFLGDLDELEILNRALTPQEVAGIFSAGAAGRCK